MSAPSVFKIMCIGVSTIDCSKYVLFKQNFKMECQIGAIPSGERHVRIWVRTRVCNKKEYLHAKVVGNF